MVDNRGISPVSNFGFTDSNSMANKMSDEKMGQGGEYFAQEIEEDEEENINRETYQDRSAQLKASLNGLAMVNAGSMMVLKSLEKQAKEKEKAKKEKSKNNQETTDEQEQESTDETTFTIE